MDLQIRLGDKLLHEIRDIVEDYGMDDGIHVAHEIMHIIAHNQTPKLNEVE